MACIPVANQLSDTFVLHVLGVTEEPPPAARKDAGMAIDSESKDIYTKYSTDSNINIIFVNFCYMVGESGLASFGQVINRSQGPGAATLSGVFDPTGPVQQIPDPVNAGQTIHATRDPEGIHAARLKITAPHEPQTTPHIQTDYNGTISVAKS